MSAFPDTRDRARRWFRTNAPDWALQSARATRERYREVRPESGLRARIRALEVEVQESRQLNRRVAELSDVVAELLIPLEQRNPTAALVHIEHYRSRL
jgi:hypothetical protein